MVCDDELVRWTDNDGKPVERPIDSNAWCDVIDSVGRALEVQFVLLRPGRWHLSKAYEAPSLEPGPTVTRTGPIDRRPALLAALKAVGKPVD